MLASSFLVPLNKSESRKTGLEAVLAGVKFYEGVSVGTSTALAG